MDRFYRSTPGVTVAKAGLLIVMCLLFLAPFMTITSKSESHSINASGLDVMRAALVGDPFLMVQLDNSVQRILTSLAFLAVLAVLVDVVFIRSTSYRFRTGGAILIIGLLLFLILISFHKGGDLSITPGVGCFLNLVLAIVFLAYLIILYRRSRESVNRDRDRKGRGRRDEFRYPSGRSDHLWGA